MPISIRPPGTPVTTEPPFVPSAAQVSRAEAQLTRLGFTPGRVDGRATAAFASALKEFQAAWELPTTGLLDPATLTKLQHTADRHARADGRVVSIGEKSKNILEDERRLARLGYDVGRADGVFSRQTAAAVVAFRADQPELADGARFIGAGTRTVLAREAAALSHAPERRRVKSSEDRRRLDLLTSTEARHGFGEGERGQHVAHLQRVLRAAGFDPQHVNGRFDERTGGALAAFQRRAGLAATGTLDTASWRALRKSMTVASGPASPAQALHERSNAVRASEKLLRKLGFEPGKVDGLFDGRTAAAVRAFERSQGLETDGVIGANQLARMKKLSKGVTLGQLHAIMPSLPMSKARAYLPLLNRAMAEAAINTKSRKAMFLAQLAHESGQLKYFEELASGAAYEGRLDLGNVRPGDGVRYKGRGPIQLTGRANYRAAGQALGLPLERHPRLAAKPSVGFRTAAWFWKSRGLNRYADAGNFNEVTRRINGGYNGLADRLAYYRRALRVL
jgi:predicted chitinase